MKRRANNGGHPVSVRYAYLCCSIEDKRRADWKYGVYVAEVLWRAMVLESDSSGA